MQKFVCTAEISAKVARSYLDILNHELYNDEISDKVRDIAHLSVHV